MNAYALKNRFEGFVQGGREEILIFFQVTKSIDAQNTSRTKHAMNRGEGLPSEQMRWRRIPEKRIQYDGIVLFMATIQEMAPIIDGEMKFFRLQVEVMDGHRHHGRIDFHNIHLCPLSGEIHWHNPNPQTDAKHVVDVR